MGNTRHSCTYRFGCRIVSIHMSIHIHVYTHVYAHVYTHVYTSLYTAPLETHHFEPATAPVTHSARSNIAVPQAQQRRHFRTLNPSLRIPRSPTVRVWSCMGVHVRWCACGQGHTVRAVWRAHACTRAQVGTRHSSATIRGQSRIGRFQATALLTMWMLFGP